MFRGTSPPLWARRMKQKAFVSTVTQTSQSWLTSSNLFPPHNSSTSISSNSETYSHGSLVDQTPCVEMILAGGLNSRGGNDSQETFPIGRSRAPSLETLSVLPPRAGMKPLTLNTNLSHLSQTRLSSPYTPNWIQTPSSTTFSEDDFNSINLLRFHQGGFGSSLNTSFLPTEAELYLELAMAKLAIEMALHVIGNENQGSSTEENDHSSPYEDVNLNSDRTNYFQANGDDRKSRDRRVNGSSTSRIVDSEVGSSELGDKTLMTGSDGLAVPKKKGRSRMSQEKRKRHARRKEKEALIAAMGNFTSGTLSNANLNHPITNGRNLGPLDINSTSFKPFSQDTGKDHQCQPSAFGYSEMNSSNFYSGLPSPSKVASLAQPTPIPIPCSLKSQPTLKRTGSTSSNSTAGGLSLSNFGNSHELSPRNSVASLSSTATPSPTRSFASIGGFESTCNSPVTPNEGSTTLPFSRQGSTGGNGIGMRAQANPFSFKVPGMTPNRNPGSQQTASHIQAQQSPAWNLGIDQAQHTVWNPNSTSHSQINPLNLGTHSPNHPKINSIGDESGNGNLAGYFSSRSADGSSYQHPQNHQTLNRQAPLPPHLQQVPYLFQHLNLPSQPILMQFHQQPQFYPPQQTQILARPPPQQEQQQQQPQFHNQNQSQNESTHVGSRFSASQFRDPRLTLQPSSTLNIQPRVNQIVNSNTSTVSPDSNHSRSPDVQTTPLQKSKATLKREGNVPSLLLQPPTPLNLLGLSNVDHRLEIKMEGHFWSDGKPGSRHSSFHPVQEHLEGSDEQRMEVEMERRMKELEQVVEEDEENAQAEEPWHVQERKRAREDRKTKRMQERLEKQAALKSIRDGENANRQALEKKLSRKVKRQISRSSSPSPDYSQVQAETSAKLETNSEVSPAPSSSPKSESSLEKALSLTISRMGDLSLEADYFRPKSSPIHSSPSPSVRNSVPRFPPGLNVGPN